MARLRPGSFRPLMPQLLPYGGRPEGALRRSGEWGRCGRAGLPRRSRAGRAAERLPLAPLRAGGRRRGAMGGRVPASPSPFPRDWRWRERVASASPRGAVSH